MVVAWLVPRETAAVSELFLCTPTMYQFTVSLYLKPDTSDARVSRCNMSSALLTEWSDLFFFFFLMLLGEHRGGTDTEVRAQKVDPGEEHSPASPVRTRTRDLSITSPSLYH